MRREHIYPHRAVRNAPLRPHAVILAVVFAASTSGAVFAFRETVLAEHLRLSNTVLEAVGIPAGGTASVEVFPAIGTARVAQIPVFSAAADPLRMFLMFTASILALLAIHKRLQLGRTFVEFLMVLILIPAGIMLFAPSFAMTSVDFALLWVRTEVLVWLFLPWLAAFLLIALRPAAMLTGAAAALGLQIYAIAWSALRLAFCLGLMHFTGVLFVALLWFAVGLLADVIYVISFHSMVVHWSAANIWGRRIAWRF